MVRRLRSENLAAPLAIWERVEATEHALHALLLGVQGVLLDTSTPSDVLMCMETILSGGVWVPPAVAKAAIVSRQCHLTKREGELMSLVACGLSNKEMAFRLGIGVGTVKVYLSRLFRKLGVADRYELALLSLRHGAGSDGTAASGLQPPCPRSVFVPRRASDQWLYDLPAP
jgi:two-component system nitrate/nitrite response regulator NarP